MSHCAVPRIARSSRSEEHTSELQSHVNLVCRLLLEKKNKTNLHLLDGHRRRFRRRTKTAFSARAGIVFPQLGDLVLFLFFFNDTATTEIYTLSLHDALPICARSSSVAGSRSTARLPMVKTRSGECGSRSEEHTSELQSHVNLVCRLLLEKKKKKKKKYKHKKTQNTKPK